MRSTFAGFTTARLAMRASQKALDVTGQNIANINTQGYTRQRLDLMSLHTGMGMDRYKSAQSVSIGNGVLSAGLTQLRDPFLDARFRNEIANVGGAEEKAAILKDLENIFDEVTKSGLQEQISDLGTMLQKLSDNVGNLEFDSMVRASADVMVKLFNQYASQLETVRKDQTYNLEKVDLPAVNDILANIKSLNENIKTNHVYGNEALELIDQRNLLIDELGSYMDIKVEMTKVPITGDPNGRTIETLKITQTKTGAVLVDDNLHATIESVQENGKTALKIAEAKKPADTKTMTGDDFQSGIFKSTLDMMNKRGEFDGTSVRGIGYYEDSLNLLASKIADVFNDLNKPSDYDEVTNPVAYKLFESMDGGAITAGNVRVSEAWIKGDIRINPAKDGSTTGKNDNVLAMIDALKQKLEYTTRVPNATDPTAPPETVRVFKGTFQEYLTNIGSVLGLDVKSTNALLDNYKTVATDLSNMRDNISKVSLDEEGVNILQYQKSYNAAARLMTALDEAIGTIISNMGVVGR